jgi:hypothetical protein
MKVNRIAAATGVFLSLAVAAPTVAFARHGADDPAGHVRHAKHHVKHKAKHHAKHHVRHGHGADDGPNHT